MDRLLLRITVEQKAGHALHTLQELNYLKRYSIDSKYEGDQLVLTAEGEDRFGDCWNMTIDACAGGSQLPYDPSAALAHVECELTGLPEKFQEAWRRRNKIQ